MLDSSAGPGSLQDAHGNAAEDGVAQLFEAAEMMPKRHDALHRSTR